MDPKLRTLLPIAATMLAAPLRAQDFQTPGMPRGRAASTGQSDQFSNEFNPAIGVVIDTFARWTEVDDSGDDGLDLVLRSVELGANAWIDPSAWAYAVVVADEEEIELEEAAVHYVGLPGRATLRAGRFFVDFGKQMQAHVHDLPYVDRPLVLREYLGEELSGTGLQLDHWVPAGDATVVRWSLGVFQSLLGGGHAHGEEEEEEEGAERFEPDRKELDELAFTARVTGFTDVGERGTLQLGLSARHVPEFGFEAGDALSEGHSNTVLGVDLTFGLLDEVAQSSWTFGAEMLQFRGDIGAELVDGPGGAELEVLDDDVLGYYAWVERAFNPFHAAGVLYSMVEHPEADKPEESEQGVYYTRNLSEFGRLRFQVTASDSDEAEDELRLTLQYTNWLGPHSHGVNW